MVIVFIKHGRSGSVTTVLHEAAEEYIRNIEVPREYDRIKDQVLKNRYVSVNN